MLSPQLKMRRARREDLPAILWLMRNDDRVVFTQAPSPTLQEEAAFAVISEDRNQLLSVAENESMVIGTLQISFIPGLARDGSWRGLIEAVRIAPDHRSRGFGRQMMIWAIEQCQARGCSLVQLTSHSRRQDAHQFYSSLGFSASHTGFKLLLTS